MSDKPIMQTMGFDADPALKTLTQLNAGFKTFEDRINSSAAALRNFNRPAADLTADAKKINTAFRDTSAEVAKSTERMTTSLGLLSRIAFTQLVISQLRVLKETLKDATTDAAAFQEKISLIGTIADGELGSFREMSAKVRGISDAFNIPLLEAGAGLYETLSANIAKGADNLKFLETAAAFGKGTITSLDQSVKLLGGTLQAFDKDADQAADVASKLFRVIDLGNASGQEIATSFNRVSGQAVAVGASFEEAAAAVTLINQRGVKFAEATTQVSGILSGLVKPSEGMEAALKRLGFSQAETAIRTLGLGGTLKALVDQTDGSAESIAQLFNNVRGLRGALAIGAQANEKYNQILADIRDTSAGIIKDKSLSIMATDGQRVTAEFNKLKNAITTELGESILSTGRAFIDVGVNAERLTAVLKAFGPVLATGTGLMAAYTTAMWSGVAANQAFMASAKGAGAGLLLGAGAAAGGDLIGDSLIDAFRRPQKLFDQAAQASIEKLRQSEAAKLKITEEADDKRVRAALETVQRLNRTYIQDTQNAARANKQLSDNTERTLGRIISAREKYVDKLRQVSEDSKQLTADSGNRITDIRLRVDDRNFERQTRNLDDPNKSAALIQRAGELAKRASADLAKAAKLGDREGIQRAQDLFAKAEAAGEEAENIALRTKNLNLEKNAVFAIDSITKQRLQSEKQLQQFQQQRVALADKERERQEAVVSRLRDASKLLIENSSIVGDDGKLLPADQQAERAAKRQAALNDIVNAGFSNKDLSISDALGLARFTSEFGKELARDPLKLQFDTETGLAKIKADLQRSFADFRVGLSFDAGLLESAIGKRLDSPDQIAQGLGEAAEKAAELRKAFSDVGAQDANIKRLQTSIAGIAAMSEDTSRKGLRLLGLPPASEDQRNLVSGLAESLQIVSQQAAISDQQIASLFGKLKELRQAALVGDVAKNAGLGVDLDQFSTALGLLKELQAAQRERNSNPAIATPGASEQQLRMLDTVLQQGATFQSALNGAVTPAANIATAFGSAARDAERMAAAAAGLRGIQPTSSFNATAPQSAASGVGSFFPQLQSLNAPAAPAAARVGGDTVNVNVGGITVQGAQGARQTAQQIAGELQRLSRRSGGGSPSKPSTYSGTSPITGK